MDQGALMWQYLEDEKGWYMAKLTDEMVQKLNEDIYGFTVPIEAPPPPLRQRLMRLRWRLIQRLHDWTNDHGARCDELNL